MKYSSGLRNSKNIKSQIAIIITFVIAVILLMVMVFINIAKVSEVKTLTAKVSDSAALRLASDIGSMGNHLKEKVLGGEEKVYSLVLPFLGVITFSAEGNFIKNFALNVVAKMGPSSKALEQTIIFSDSINEEIFKSFTEMTIHNSTREKMLYEAIALLQTDDVLLVPMGEGLFAEDIDGDGEADGGSRFFDLSEIGEVRNAKAVGRFFAWYHGNRLPMVSEQGLKMRINDFLDDLQEYINMEEWDDGKWIYKKAYFRIKGNERFKVTGTAPSWVKAGDIINILSIDEADRDSEGRYNPKGFLKEKFIDLAENLEGDYDIPFCDPVFLWWGTECGDIDGVIKDIRDLTDYVKEVVELPETSKVVNIAQWFDAKFYDLASVETEEEDVKDIIYDRLTRSSDEIEEWIEEFETLDSGIKSEIAKAHGHNQYGLGSAVSSCYTEYNCCASDCTKRCCEASKNCSFKGIYCSACGGNAPPVCGGGDLYGVIPSWCNLSNRSPNCHPSCGGCSRKSQCDDACNYQGLLANENTLGPTEVGQAIKILIALKEDLENIKTLIQDFAVDIEEIRAKDDPLKNQIDYAWEGKPEGDSKIGRRHLVSVRIDGYPEELPHILEGERGRFDLRKNYALEAERGSFIVSVSRYDESVSLGWWNMRYQKEEGEDTSVTEDLEDVIKIVYNDERVPFKVSEGVTIEEYKTAALEDYKAAMNSLITDAGSPLKKVLEKSIPSKTEGFYGPDKKDIYIKKVQ